MDIAIIGTVGFAEKNPLYLTLKANADLGILQDIDHDFYSSGVISVDAAVHGSFSAPVANGSLQMKECFRQYQGHLQRNLQHANGTISAQRIERDDPQSDRRIGRREDNAFRFRGIHGQCSALFAPRDRKSGADPPTGRQHCE